MDDLRDFDVDGLAALVGSRLCHDLVSPLGAIGNGVELLQMTHTAPSPELQLIADAVRDANARLRFFRVAFGAAKGEQILRGSELADILNTHYGQSRLTLDWPMQDLPRRAAKELFLMINCAETALPVGGVLAARRTPVGFRLEATGPRLRVAEELWFALATPGAPMDPVPAEVQFALLRDHVAREGRGLRIDVDDARLVLTS